MMSHEIPQTICVIVELRREEKLMLSAELENAQIQAPYRLQPEKVAKL